MSSHWPTADQQPGATPAQIEFARRWRDMPKVVFSSTTSAVDWNARLVTGDAVTEITRLKTEDGGPMDVGAATLAAAAGRSCFMSAPNAQAAARHVDRPRVSLLTRSAGAAQNRPQPLANRRRGSTSPLSWDRSLRKLVRLATGSPRWTPYVK